MSAKTRFLLAFILIAITVVSAQPAPVNPNASPEARALLKYIYSISGKYTLTGQHNYPNHIARWTDRTYDLTGKYPAVYGQDFGFQGEEDKDTVLARPALIEEAKRQWQHGAIPTLTWHAVRPISDEPVTFKDDVQGKLSDFEWSELLTPGTALNLRWCAQVDVVAGYLKQLRDARVPVLFRPYHEMNGSWFWWGGRPGKNGSSALYRQLYDRFVNVHHLDNLVWAWNVNAPNNTGMAVADYYPGADVSDMLTLDVYGEFKQQYYTDMQALAAGKPLALGEVGYVPSAEVLKAQPGWTYFMIWSEWVEEANSLDSVKSVFDSPQALSRNDQRVSEPLAAIRKATATPAPQPVTPNASSSAKALLASLYGPTGKAILGGQQLPANAQSITWKPARPTDAEPATEQSLRTSLTAFEWNQLLAPGTTMNKHWTDQVDALAARLKKLDEQGVAVLFRPYPQSNGKLYWWANRKGIEGSSALYRQLFDRLVNHHGLKNLVWVWAADTPPGWPDKTGQYADYFPGLIYADAISVEAQENAWVQSREREVSLIAVGKPTARTDSKAVSAGN
jgi:mannan endo-1,4-beta-mannosidase